MIKILNLFKPYPFRPRFMNTVKVLCVTTEVKNVNLFFEFDKNKREKSRKRNHWDFSEYFSIASVLVPIGVTIAACDAYLKHNEKRFFRSVLYGLEEEVQR